MQLDPKQKRILTTLAEVEDGGINGLTKLVLDLQDDVERVEAEKKGDKGEKGDQGEPGRDGVDGLNGQDGKDGKDGNDGRNGKDGTDGRDGTDGKDGSPDQPKDVRNKLESLKGDERLDVSSIKGLTKKFTKWADDIVQRAISILDQRTSFLINKVSNLSDRVDRLPTSLSSVWGSITGTLSNQTDLQSALDAKANALGPDDNYVTDAEKIVIGNTSGTNTGDQTSIVGITGTKAQFDTAVTDGNFLYVGDVTQYTDEMAQDAVGGILGAEFTYNDATPSIVLATGGIDETKLDTSVNASLDLADTALQSISGLDHGLLGDLLADDHTQYALLAGRSGGQTLLGGTGAGDDLTLNAGNTTGFVIVGSGSGNRIQIGTSTPSAQAEFLTIAGSVNADVAAVRGIIINPVLETANAAGALYSLGGTFRPGANMALAYGQLNVPGIDRAADDSTSYNINNYRNVYWRVDTRANYTGTIDLLQSFVVDNPIKNNGSATITTVEGFTILDLGVGTNNRGIVSQVSAGTNKHNLYISGTADNYLEGLTGVGTTTMTGKLNVDQSSTTAAIPVLVLDQADVSEEMIEFVTTIGTGNAIEAVGAKTLTTTHFIKISIPGGLTRYIPCGTIA